MKYFYSILIASVLTMTSINLCIANDLELTKEFNLITSKNASGYLKPMFTSFGEGLNTSLYNTSYYSNGWSFGINFSFAGMIIPDSQLMYEAELPDLYGNTSRIKTAQLRKGVIYENLSGTTKQPTIYGGESYSIFASPQSSTPPDSFYKSVGFLEGKNIGFMPAVPTAQLYVGLPTRTELILRFLTFSMQDAPFTYFTFGINQNIDKAFGFNSPDDPFSYGLNIAYHSISRDRGLDVSSLGIGLNASNRFGEDFDLYGGLMFETLSGNILLVRKDFNNDDVLNSPYSEIRNGEDLDINVESFNSFRLTVGAAYDVSIFRFHGDVSYAAQPILNIGVSIKMLEHKEEKFEPIEYKMPNPEFSKPEQIALTNFTKPYTPITSPIAIIKEKVWDFDIALTMNAVTEENENTLDTITIEEFESRQTRAILPYVFYDENESVLPAKYNRITKNETEKFSFSAMLGKSPMESYYDVINVIGYRLREKPDANLLLTGTNCNIGLEKNNKKLSNDRAENIKNYLTEVWNINPNRIKITARNLPQVPSNNKELDGQAENRRVEISSNDLDIAAPVFIVDTLLRVSPDAIRYIHKVESEAGLAKWNINSSSGGVLLKSFSGLDVIDENTNWYLSNEGTKKRLLSGTLETRFTAFDEQNNFRNIALSHPIKIISVKDKRLNATKDTSLNVYNLILFDFNKSDLNPSNKKITDFIKSEITPTTDVSIFGFTDRIGDEDYNMKLSTARAESTGKSLGGHPYKVTGLGESKLIYDNELPEGRFYCRTVIVEAKVPIN